MAFSTFPNNPFPPSTAQFNEGKNDAIQAEIDAIKDGSTIDSFSDVETALASLESGLTNIQNQSGEVASGFIDGDDTVDVQLPGGVAAYLLCTFRDNDYFAGLYYLTYKVGDVFTCSPILSSTSMTVTGNLPDRHITIANGTSYTCCYAIKNLAHSN